MTCSTLILSAGQFAPYHTTDLAEGRRTGDEQAALKHLRFCQNVPKFPFPSLALPLKALTMC